MNERMIYKGRVLNLALEQALLPNGRSVELEMIRHPGASAVVPLREDGRVVMIRQYRHAAGGLIYEIPGGKLDGDEPTLDCAKRELAEETGLAAGQWDFLGAILTTPGFTDERIHLYLARGLRSGSTSHERDEYIEIAEFPLEETVRMIRDGTITDGKTICGLVLAHFFVSDVKRKT